jgi:hypothetical protein
LIPAQARGWSLERMQFSVRLGNVLGNLGCERLGDLHGLTYEQIGEAKSCGQKLSMSCNPSSSGFTTANR